MKSNHGERTRSRRTGRTVACLAAVAALTTLAACGGDDDDSTEPAGTEAEATSPGDTSPEATEPATAPDSAAPGDTSDAPATTTAGSDVPATSAAADVPERRQGGSATMILSGQPNLLDPQLQRVSLQFGQSTTTSAVYGHLAFFDPSTGEPVLYFLESLEPNDDYTEWTATLHENIKFSDGTPLNAEAIVYNIERARDPELGSPFQAAAEAVEVEAVDELTAVFTLPAPDPTYPASLISNWAGIGSPTAMEQAKADGVEFGTVPVGAGPFMVKEWDPGQRLVLERNPFFAEFHPGEPYLDELVFETLFDQPAMISALQTNSAQMAQVSGGTNVAQMGDVANIMPTTTSGGSNLLFNVTKPPFDDVRARLAVSYAIDRVGAAEAFAPGTDPLETLFAETSPFHNPDLALRQQDKEEAQRLFDELAAEGKPVHVKLTTLQTAEQTAFIDFLFAQFAEYENVTFEPDIRPYAEYVTAANTGQYEFLTFGTYVINPMPVLYDTYYPGQTYNSMGWENERVIEAFDALGTAGTVEEQKAIWDIIQEEQIKEEPIMWVGEGVLSFAYTDDIVAPRTVNLGLAPVWGEVGYAAE